MELQISNISKTNSNGAQVRKDVTLTIPAGLYGLLGPNRARKSSLTRLLSGLVSPSGGKPGKIITSNINSSL